MSLHDIHLDDAIITLVETMLPRFSPNDLGLMITLDLRASNFETEKSKATILTFIFHRPSNYTKVMAFLEPFSAELNPILHKETEVDLASDHDSCWSSDGLNILNKDWIEKSNTIGHPANNKVSFFNTFSMFRKPKYVHFKSLKINREKRKVKFVIDEFISMEKMLIFMDKGEKS